MLLDDGARTYVWGPQGPAYGVDKSSGAISVYHTDGLGSVRAVTDAAGSVVQTYGTDAFGVPDAALSQGTSTQPFGFTGEQALGSGLVDLRARMYDPQLGRFLQRHTLPGFTRVSRPRPCRQLPGSGHVVGETPRRKAP